MPRPAAVDRLARLLPRAAFTATLVALLCLGTAGCRREPEVKVRTPDQVRAEIQKVERDPKMPPNVKAMVLGLLRRELEQAEKHAKQGK